MVDLSWASGGATATIDDEKVQGSKAWLKWRGKGLGSSDAAVLLGLSPWKDIHQLLEEKLGLWTPTFGEAQQRAMDRGKELEPKIRRWYETNIRGGVLFPDATSEHPVHKIFRASYDGLNSTFINPEDGSIGRCLEIKAPNAKDHEYARQGLVPEKYQPQVQWLMMNQNIPWCDYVSYGTDGTYAVVAVKADLIMQIELKIRALLFWNHVENKSPIKEWFKWERPAGVAIDLSSTTALLVDFSPEITQPIAETKPTIEEQGIEALVAETLEAQAAHKAAEARFEVLKDRLKKHLGKTESMNVGEAVFGFNERKGNVSYRDIPELIGVDLEQYRGKPVKVFYFKRIGEKNE